MIEFGKDDAYRNSHMEETFRDVVSVLNGGTEDNGGSVACFFSPVPNHLI